MYSIHATRKCKKGIIEEKRLSMCKKIMYKVDADKLINLIREHGYSPSNLSRLFSPKNSNTYFHKNKLTTSGISQQIKDKLEVIGINYDDYKLEQCSINIESSFEQSEDQLLQNEMMREYFRLLKELKQLESELLK